MEKFNLSLLFFPITVKSIWNFDHKRKHYGEGNEDNRVGTKRMLKLNYNDHKMLLYLVVATNEKIRIRKTKVVENEC
jgi:hypothetical protein